ncbi:hypothetical protein SNARM312S_01395 [Streptomyces narbonensis]
MYCGSMKNEGSIRPAVISWAMVPVATERRRSRPRGSSGAFALLSTRTKTVSRTTAAARAPVAIGSVQPSSPAVTMPKTRASRPMVPVMPPRTSAGGRLPVRAIFGT